MKYYYLLFSLITLNLVAQESDYDFNIEENNLEKHAYDFSLKLNPVFTDISNDNTVGGYTSSLFFRINTIMALHGEFIGSYSNVVPDVESSNSSTNAYNGVVSGDYVPYMQYKGGATLYLWSDEFESSSRVNLPSENRNGRKQRYFLEVDKTDKLRQLGFRVEAGNYQGQIAEKGLEFEGYNENTLIHDLENTSGKNFSSITYNLFSGGFSYEQINHLELEIKTDSIGIRSKKNHWRIYADFLLARNMNIGSMKYTWDDISGKQEEVYELQKWTIPDQDSFSMEYMGYRAGFEYSQTGKIGLTYGIEAGARPGTGNFLARTYISAKLGVSFNWKIVKY